jgi:hypothetical protein
LCTSPARRPTTSSWSARGRAIAPQADIRAEAERLLAAIDLAGLRARLIGGMAIRILCGERLDPVFDREIADLDFVVPKGEGRDLGALLEAEGYDPDKEFNALQGARRMLFWDVPNNRQVDVFVGSFEMCHELPLADRVDERQGTLPGADLLLTKLQIVNLNRKDATDACALLASTPIDDAYIASLTSQDWGLQHTIELNLDRLGPIADELALDDAGKGRIHEAIASLRAAIEAEPKSRRWKMRDRIGERKQWYETPEEVDRA